MPINKPSLGTINTGPTTSLKLSSTDASVEAKKVVAATTAKAKRQKPTEDQIKYITIGEPVFNTTSNRKRISFIGGAYFVNKTDTKLIEDLDYFVDLKRIKVEE